MLRLILILLIIPNVFYSVEWEHFSTFNTSLKSPQIREFFKSNDGSIWFYTNNEIGNIVNDKITIYNEYNKENTLNGIMSINQDVYNNLIFRTYDGSLIFFIEGNKFQTFETYKYDYLEYNPKSFVIKDSLIYVNISEVNRIAAFEYNKNKKEYFRNKNKDIICDTSDEVILGQNMIFYDNHFIFRKFGNIFAFLDYNSKKYTEIKSIKGIEFDLKDIYKHSVLLIKNVDNELIINIVNNYDSSSVLYKINGSLNNVNNLTAERIDVIDYKSNDIKFIYDVLKLNNDEYLIPAFTSLYYFKNGKFNIVKKPEIEYIDSIGFYPISVFVDGNDIYVGTIQTGYFKSNLNEALDDKNLILNIENDFLPSSTLLNVYPLPSSNIIHCEFFIRNEITSDLSCTLYDLNGNKLGTLPKNINHKIGDLYEVNLDVSTLQIGTYLVKVTGKNSSLDFKIIKN